MQKETELMKRMRRCGHLLYHCCSLNQSQNKVLFHLYRDGPMNQKALLEKMCIQPGSLSEVVAKVEHCGLVEKQRPEEDKRCCVLTLTPKGRQQAITFEQQDKELAERLFSSLSAEQKDELMEILSILLDDWSDLQPCR